MSTQHTLSCPEIQARPFEISPGDPEDLIRLLRSPKLSSTASERSKSSFLYQSGHHGHANNNNCSFMTQIYNPIQSCILHSLPSGRELANYTSKPQVRGSKPGLSKVDSAIHPFSGSIKGVPSLRAWELNNGGTRQTDHLLGTTSHAPEHLRSRKLKKAQQALVLLGVAPLSLV
ncbi:hypothetical protein TNCV_1259391 [Trichonephila clavipes]|nr:hypothetical protein TNCV_1259391 [Trichonephila clavipes]